VHATPAFEAAEAALGVDARGLQRAVAAPKGRALLATHVLDRALPSGALLAARALNASSGVQLTGAPRCVALQTPSQLELTP
jgi:hypothetical protein